MLLLAYEKIMIKIKSQIDRIKSNKMAAELNCWNDSFTVNPPHKRGRYPEIKF